MASFSYNTNVGADYQNLFDNCIINQVHQSELKKYSDNIFKNKARYELLVAGSSIPWYFIGLVHHMECSLSFEKHLYNGDLLTARTVRYPAGRPLFDKRGTAYTFEESALDCIQYQKLDKITDWSLPHLLYTLEGYNGYGYKLYHPTVNTPYLWSYTNQYTSGKYVEEKDALTGKYKTHFKPELVSKQCGIAAILKQMVIDGYVVPA